MLPASRVNVFSLSRIGFVFVVNTEAETDGLSDAGVGLYRLLSYIADEYDVSQALMSMVSVSRLWRNLSVKNSDGQL